MIYKYSVTKNLVKGSVFLFTLFCIVFLSNATQISALNPILQGPDILDFSNPTPNSKVKGTINIIWKMYDDEQNIIPYTANVYDAQTCNVTNYGQINSNPNGTSSQTQDNVLNWNTRTTLSSPSLADGNYCLKICAALKNGASYSACNGRNITIINNNKLPSITSIPNRLTIVENESWSYQIQAQDSDGDMLSYRFVTKPSWLDINSQNGLISSNNVDKNPGRNDTLKYSVVIAVDDNFSGTVTQQFEITVKKIPAAIPAPTKPNQPIPSPNQPTPNPQQLNEPTVITILAPVKNEILNDEVNISWNVTDANGLAEIKLQYSQNNVNWSDITTINNSNTKKYTWDISNLEDGNYFIRIVAKDLLGTVTSKVSNEFTIQKKQVDQTPVDSAALIINLSPVNNAELNSKTPEISGEFVPSEGGIIDTSTFQIKLDDIDIGNLCEVSELSFKCILENDLNEGSHKINISIKDSNEKSAVSEWSFMVKTESTPLSYSNDNVFIFGSEISRGSLTLVIVICFIVFLLLVIPWILYVLWNKKNKDKIIADSQKVEYTSTQNNQPVNNDYGYYIPPYNPIPTEPLSPEPYQSTNYTDQFSSTTNNTFELDPVEENTQLIQAEPQIEVKTEDTNAVLPDGNEVPLETLAQEEPKVSQEYFQYKTDEANNKKLSENTPFVEYVEPVKTDVSVKNINKNEQEFIEPKPVD